MINALVSVVIVVGLAMAIIAAAGNEDKRYDAFKHIELIAEGFQDIPSFEELKGYFVNEEFTMSSSEEWRFKGFISFDNHRGFITVKPDMLRDEKWGGFEWLNEPIGVVAAFLVRVNAAIVWMGDWVSAFFTNIWLLFPQTGMVERG